MIVLLSLTFSGLGSPIRRGLGGISMLKWSPTGDYFFAAKLYSHNRTFMLIIHAKFLSNMNWLIDVY